MQHVHKSAVNKDGKESETGKTVPQTASGRGKLGLRRIRRFRGKKLATQTGGL